MKILSWNCRGLGQSSAARALKKLLRSQCLDLVFLMETRLRESDPKVNSSLTCGALSNLHMIDCSLVNNHRYGGLAILWNDVLKIDILKSNKTLIDMYITSSNYNFSWYATGIYGYPYTSKKHLTCEAINELNHNRITEKWLFLEISILFLTVLRNWEGTIWIIIKLKCLMILLIIVTSLT